MNLALLVIFILTIVFSIYTLVYERRDRSFSCHTWAECGYLERPTYNHDIPANLDVVVDQGTSRDGTVFYTREVLNLPRPDLLVLVVSKDAASWGAESSWSSGRTPADLIDLLIRTDLDFTHVSIGLLTTQQDEFDTLKQATHALPFARTSILLQPPHASDQYDRTSRDDNDNNNDNDDDAKQQADQQRRANIARARNFLMLRTVQDEPHLLWIDADIVELSDGLVQRMMDQAGKNPHVGLMTARCRLAAKDSDYDSKAWSLSPSSSSSSAATEPASGQPEADDHTEKQEKDSDPAAAAAAAQKQIFTGAVPLSEQASAASELRTARTQAGDLVRGTADDALVPLDSVGATILYVRSDLVLRGVVFPPFNVVGTLWDHEGWTGMETEGICYMAEQVAGKGCYLLGGDNFVRHAELAGASAS